MDRMFSRTRSTSIASGHTESTPWDIRPVLNGDLDKLPPLSAKTVRVFLSSTFSDMSPERNALMEYVYPQLKNFCRQQYRLEFQHQWTYAHSMMDLRWGIREQSHDDHTIIEFCMREIENCQNQSLGPSFVLLLGQKYGYRPFPPTIDALEFEAIHEELMSKESEKDVELVDLWFRKDLNVKPPVYKLQPISSVLQGYSRKQSTEGHEEALRKWNSTSEQLQTIMRKGVTHCVQNNKLPSEAKEKYFISVTEYEINRGLESPAAAAQSLCFIRNIKNLEENLEHPRAHRYLDTLSGGSTLDLEAKQLLDRLHHEKIANLFLDERNVEYFELNWNNPESTYPSDDKNYLKQFCNTFIDKMQWLINRSAHQATSLSCQAEVVEILQHLSTCRTKSSEFRGREEALKGMRDYLEEQKAITPVVLYGESGSGKTSVIAKVVREIKNWFKDATPSVVLRFLGFCTTGQSCSIRMVLKSLCWQISTLCNEDVSAIPVDYPGLVENFHNLIELASVLLPNGLILLLDGLDQLSPNHRAYSLAWLPKSLPDNVHLIVSTLPDRYDILDTLKVMVENPDRFIRVQQLGAELSSSLIREWLEGKNRCVTPEQFQIVENALANCSLPLYTSLVFEEVCRWPSYLEPDQTILESTVDGIIDRLFDRIERYHGFIFVSHLLSYLTASRNGLSDVELEDVLSLDDVVLNDVFQHWLPPLRRVPPLLITRVMDELSSYLTMRETNSTVVIYWYHGQFIKAATRRYLSDDDHRMEIFAMLAHYYLGTWGRGVKKKFKYSFKQLQNMSQRTKRESQADRKVPDQPLHFGPDPLNPGKLNYNLRKLSELPFYLVESEMFTELKAHVLFNYEWLHAKLSAMSLHDLLSDFNLATDAGLDDIDIQLLAGALRVGGSHLNRNPDTLSFDLIGRLLHYYDRHSEVHNGIRSLLQQCDMKSAKHSALLPLLPCFDTPSAMVLYALEGHTQVTSDIIFSDSTNELISVSKDGTVAFWDLGTGERARTIDVSRHNPGRNTRLYQSPDGQLLIVDYDAIESPIEIYDMKTCKLLHSTGVRLPTQQRGFLAGDLLCRQKSIIDIRAGTLIRTVDDFALNKAYVPCSISPDGTMILIGDETDVQLFDFIMGAPLATFKATSQPTVLAISSDSRRAYAGYADDCMFRVFDIDRNSSTLGDQLIEPFDCSDAAEESGTVFQTEQRFPREITDIQCSPANSCVVLVTVRRFRLLLLDTSTNPCSHVVMSDRFDKEHIIAQSAVSYDGRYVLASVDNLLKVWQAETGMFLQAIQLHSTPGYALAVSRCRNLVATGSTINTAIRVLDLDKAEVIDAPQLKVYENPVDCMSCAYGTRLAFVKSYYGLASSVKGYKFMNSFGIDVWNISTGNWKPFLPFDRYGKLVKMEVSPDGSLLALLLNAMHNFTVVILSTSPTCDILFAVWHKYCTSFRVSPNWRHLVTCSSTSAKGIENQLTLWKIPSSQEATKRSPLDSIEAERLFSLDDAGSPVFTLDSRLLLYVDLLTHVVIAYDLRTLAPRHRLDCGADIIAALPCRRRHVLVMKVEGDVTKGAAVWELSRKPNEPVHLRGTLAPSGVLHMSADGRIAVDGFLQVFDLDTGELLGRYTEDKEGEELDLVRLTSDGKFIIWADDISVKVCQTSDGLLVGHASTHQRPTSLQTIDHGYIILVGLEDGHLMTMKLNPEMDKPRNHCGSSMPSILRHSTHRTRYRPQNVEDRRNFLLDSDACSRETIETFDELFRNPVQYIPDDELPSVSDEVIRALVRNADVPHTVISTLHRSQDLPGSWAVDDKDSHIRDHDRRGSSPMATRGMGSPSMSGSPLTGDLDYRSSTPSPVLYKGAEQYLSSGSIVGNETITSGWSSLNRKFKAKRSRSAQDLYLTYRHSSNRDDSSSISSSTLPKSARLAVRNELTRLLQARLGKEKTGVRTSFTQKTSNWFRSKKTNTDQSNGKNGVDKCSNGKRSSGEKHSTPATHEKQRLKPFRALFNLPLSSSKQKQAVNELGPSANDVGTPHIGFPSSRERTPSV